MIDQWRRGLFWLPIGYLVGSGAMMILLSTKAHFQEQRQELRLLQQELRAVDPARDKERIDEIEEQLSAVSGTLLGSICWLLASVAAVLMCYGILVYGTWQVTGAPSTTMETQARWAALLIPLLMWAYLIGFQPGLARIAAKICGVVIAIGQHQAYQKISLVSRQPRLGRRIEWIDWGISLVLATMVLVALSCAAGKRPELIQQIVIPTFLVLWSCLIVALSLTLWQLRSGLHGLQNQWLQKQWGNEFDDDGEGEWRVAAEEA